MTKIELPPITEKDQARLIGEAKLRLPLSDCSVERNNLLCAYESFGELEYVAPQGMGFRMTGKFALPTETDDVAHMQYPQKSRQFLEEEMHDQIVETQLSHGISYQDALAIYIDEETEDLVTGYDDGQLPEEFFGDRLALRIIKGQVVVCVKGPVSAYADPRTAVINAPINSEGKLVNRYHVWFGRELWHWQRTIAEGLLDGCKVDKCTYQAPEPEPYLPADHSDEMTLWVPGHNRPFYLSRYPAIGRRGITLANKIPEPGELREQDRKREQQLRHDQDLPF